MLKDLNKMGMIYHLPQIDFNAKALNVKVQGLGKYALANKLAKAFIEKGSVTVSDRANINCLKREEITVLKTLGRQNLTDVAVAMRAILV